MSIFAFPFYNKLFFFFLQTVNHYRKQGQSDEEIFKNLNNKYNSLKPQAKKTTQNINTNNIKSKPVENTKTYTTNWDSKGRVYYTDQNGNKLNPQSNVNSFEKAKRKMQAAANNVGNWLNETNPNSEAYKQKANLILTLETLPLGAGKAVTQWGASKLMPYLGKKIGQGVAEGIGAGTVSGGVYGTGNALIENKNPLVEGLKGAATGGILGGGLGLVGSKAVQVIKAGQLKKLKDTKTLRKAETNFYKDYIQSTSVKRKDLGNISFTQAVLETVSKSPQAGKNFATLKNDIKNANYIREEMPNHPRKDNIVKFHRLEKDKQEFLIGETSDGKKYYMSKLKDGSDGQPSRVGSEPPNNIMNDVEKNINTNITKSENIKNIFSFNSRFINCKPELFFISIHFSCVD